MAHINYLSLRRSQRPRHFRRLMGYEKKPQISDQTIQKKTIKEKAYEGEKIYITRRAIGWHPANEEEAVARIEAIEAEYERTGVSYNEEEFFNKLNEERTWSNADDFEKELTAQYPWLEDWKRSISIEDFRKNCKNKLNKLFP